MFDCDITSELCEWLSMKYSINCKPSRQPECCFRLPGALGRLADLEEIGP